MSRWFEFLGAATMLLGLVLEFAGFLGMRFSVGRGLRWRTLGGILFFAGAGILLAARACSAGE